MGRFKGISLGSTLIDNELEGAADFGNMCLAGMDKDAVYIPDISKDTTGPALVIRDLVKASNGSPVAGVSFFTG